MPIEVLVLTVGYKRPQYLYRSKGPFHHHFIAGGERQGDIEKILENIVYQQLVRMGYAVSVGQLRAGEVDFVCTKSNERLYVQVAYLIASEETEKREFGSLDNIKDNYPKYFISMDSSCEKK